MTCRTRRNKIRKASRLRILSLVFSAVPSLLEKSNESLAHARCRRPQGDGRGDDHEGSPSRANSAQTGSAIDGRSMTPRRWSAVSPAFWKPSTSATSAPFY